ncbi:MAG: phytanoyl-CoA dioxygenase family protein [Rhizomicrobium sp.]
MKRLDHHQVDTFRRDGILFPIPLCGPGEVAEWLARLERIEAQRAGRLPPASNAKPHLLIPWLWDIVHDPRIVDPVEDLLGPNLLCWGTSFIIKNAQDPRYVAWHQDATYWGLSEPKAVTVWLAFTPSTAESGCVRMLPGTHRDTLAHANTRDPNNLLGRREEVLAKIDDQLAVDVTLAPGEASFHDALILHGSDPNRSGHRRVGFSMRFIPADIRHVGAMRNSATLVRGQDFGHFDLEQKPEGEFHPAASARHSKVLRSAMSTIFATGERPLPHASQAAGVDSDPKVE